MTPETWQAIQTKGVPITEFHQQQRDLLHDLRQSTLDADEQTLDSLGHIARLIANARTSTQLQACQVTLQAYRPAQGRVTH